MKLTAKLAVIALFSLIISLNTQAQSLPETGNLGIRATITNQTTIEVPYMLNENLSLAPYLGFNIFSDSDNNANDGSKAFMVGVVPRYYLSDENSIATYATGNLGISINSSNVPNSNSVTDFNLGVGYGAEYFFSENFALSADANINLRAGDSRTRFSTLAKVSASVYF